MMDGTWQELFGFLEQLDGTLEKLTGILKEKTAAVRRDDLTAVNDCMKREQAVSLSLRAMDQKREKLLSALGLSGRPLSALPADCPEELRPRARELSERVRDRYQIYQSAAEVSRTTLEINLHQIEKVIASEGDAPDGGTLADIRA